MWQGRVIFEVGYQIYLTSPENALMPCTLFWETLLNSPILQKLLDSDTYQIDWKLTNSTKPIKLVTMIFLIFDNLYWRFWR